jgi:hypothetical protein
MGGIFMEIDSVRELKSRLAGTVIPAVVFEAKGIRALGLTARSESALPRVRPGVALGIAEGHFRLAVRIQRRTLEEDRQLLSRIHDSAKGEVDIRYVGRIAKAPAAAAP